MFESKNIFKSYKKVHRKVGMLGSNQYEIIVLYEKLSIKYESMTMSTVGRKILPKLLGILCLLISMAYGKNRKISSSTKMFYLCLK